MGYRKAHSYQLELLLVVSIALSTESYQHIVYKYNTGAKKIGWYIHI